ncbi:MAG: hypothetical protein JXC85_05095 [Candidatus Aenigmarchaeota archaeon]|nr:hypothetical protein [Candidatus Aenigmarchaeota archaeon]
MADIRSIDMHDNRIDITLTINRTEYKLLKHNMSDILILPCGKDSMIHFLTTGKLGNSNRIMLPKKLLAKYKISTLEKKVPSNIFKVDEDAYLLIKIKKSGLGVPTFKEE